MEYNEILKVIGSRLRAKRQAMLLSQQEVADRINVPRIYISKIENGKHIEVKLKVIIKMCAFYDIKLSDVINNDF